jgi:hypothetical protein
MIKGISEAFQDASGGTSFSRLSTGIIIAVILLMWVSHYVVALTLAYQKKDFSLLAVPGTSVELVGLAVAGMGFKTMQRKHENPEVTE